jgi:hypothetical protein
MFGEHFARTLQRLGSEVAPELGDAHEVAAA